MKNEGATREISKAVRRYDGKVRDSDEYREMLGFEPLGPDRGGDEIMIATNNYQAYDPTAQPEEGEGNNDSGI